MPLCSVVFYLLMTGEFPQNLELLAEQKLPLLSCCATRTSPLAGLTLAQKLSSLELTLAEKASSDSEAFLSAQCFQKLRGSPR